MKWLDLKFYPEFRPAMLADIKVATARTNRYGAEVGDRFRRFGAVFEVTAVRRRTSEYVAVNCWDVEGTESEYAFRKLWRRIHPRLPWTRMVWHIWFRRVRGESKS